MAVEYATFMVGGRVLRTEEEKTVSTSWSRSNLSLARRVAISRSGGSLSAAGLGKRPQKPAFASAAAGTLT